MKNLRNLIVFVKNPIKGRVKTRLGETIGNAEAVRVYQALLAKTKSVISDLSTDRIVYYGDFINDNDLWSSTHFKKALQTGETLGNRMQNAFQESFEKGYQKVIIIGSDCPELSAEIIEQAYQLLDVYDVVLGPAEDGGYYLLGTKCFIPEIFNLSAWSTATVLEETLAIIQKHSLSHQLLPTLSDVDYEEDYIKFKDLIMPFMAR